MKRKQLIILLFSVVSLGILCFFYLNTVKKVTEKPKNEAENKSFSTKTVFNDIHNYELMIKGQICENPVFDIVFEVDGPLISGDSVLMPGKEFKKNQLLYRINNEEPFLQLASKKNELIKNFSAIIPALETKFPEEKNKWTGFLDAIKPTKMLPEFPSLFSPSERIFLIEKGFIQAFVKAQMLEKKMEKYFYMAPFDGKFIEATLNPGDVVTQGTPIAKIAENGPLTAKITIPKRDLYLYLQQKHIRFTNKYGKIIGNGSFLRSESKPQNTQLIEVYYLVQSNPKSTFVPKHSVKIISKHYTNQKCTPLPYKALRGTNVLVLVDNVATKKAVKIIAKNPTTYYVTGLKDGEKVILN